MAQPKSHGTKPAKAGSSRKPAAASRIWQAPSQVAARTAQELQDREDEVWQQAGAFVKAPDLAAQIKAGSPHLSDAKIRQLLAEQGE